MLIELYNLLGTIGTLEQLIIREGERGERGRAESEATVRSRRAFRPQ